MRPDVTMGTGQCADPRVSARKPALTNLRLREAAAGFSVSSQRMGADKRAGCSGSAACCSQRVLSMSWRPNSSSSISLDDIDLPSRRISIAGHRQPLGELTRDALLAWLDYRRATWPDTASRHVLITRKSALGTGPVSASYLAGYLGRRHRGISLEHIRRDRILHEALATGADPLHLTLIFNIDHTTAMSYAGAARKLLDAPAGHDQHG